jgi:hypothetical protein
VVVIPADRAFVNETIPTELKDEIVTVNVLSSSIDFTG